MLKGGWGIEAHRCGVDQSCATVPAKVTTSIGQSYTSILFRGERGGCATVIKILMSNSRQAHASSELTNIASAQKR